MKYKVSVSIEDQDKRIILNREIEAEVYEEKMEEKDVFVSKVDGVSVSASEKITNSLILSLIED